ncbi:hypothetical protein Pelo_3253 [Pelomyxa schiedti]|nr:hypothetical protein Pelo_3253 [Pelomyxa schiedti]
MRPHGHHWASWQQSHQQQQHQQQQKQHSRHQQQQQQQQSPSTSASSRARGEKSGNVGGGGCDTGGCGSAVGRPSRVAGPNVHPAFHWYTHPLSEPDQLGAVQSPPIPFRKYFPVLPHPYEHVYVPWFNPWYYSFFFQPEPKKFRIDCTTSSRSTTCSSSTGTTLNNSQVQVSLSPAALPSTNIGSPLEDSTVASPALSALTESTPSRGTNTLPFDPKSCSDRPVCQQVDVVSIVTQTTHESLGSDCQQPLPLTTRSKNTLASSTDDFKDDFEFVPVHPMKSFDFEPTALTIKIHTPTLQVVPPYAMYTTQINLNGEECQGPLISLLGADLWFGLSEVHNPKWVVTPLGSTVSWVATFNSPDGFPEKPASGELLFLAPNQEEFTGTCTFESFQSGSVPPITVSISGKKLKQVVHLTYNIIIEDKTAPCLMSIVGDDIYFNDAQVQEANWNDTTLQWENNDVTSGKPMSAFLTFSPNREKFLGVFKYDSVTPLNVKGSLREQGDISIEEILQFIEGANGSPQLYDRVKNSFTDMKTRIGLREFSTTVFGRPNANLSLLGHRIYFDLIEVHNPTWSETTEGQRVTWSAEDNSLDSSPSGKPQAADIIFSSQFSSFSGSCLSGQKCIDFFSGLLLADSTILASKALLQSCVRRFFSTQLRRDFVQSFISQLPDKRPDFNLVALLFDEEFSIHKVLNFSKVHDTTWNLIVDPENLTIPVDGVPPFTHQVRAIQLAVYCSTGQTFSTSSNMVICVHTPTKKAFEWEVNCLGDHTGFLPLLFFKSPHSSHWEAQIIAVPERVYSWQDTKSGYRSCLLDALPIPGMLHKVMILKVIEAKISTESQEIPASYVIIEHGTFKGLTTVSKKTLNPTWNQSFTIPLTQALVRVRVVNKNLIFDDEIGEVNVNLDCGITPSTTRAPALPPLDSSASTPWVPLLVGTPGPYPLQHRTRKGASEAVLVVGTIHLEFDFGYEEYLRKS